MDTSELEAEIIRISRLPEIQREHEVHKLHQEQRCNGLRKSLLRELVQEQANAGKEAQAQDELQVLLGEYFLLSVRGKVRIGQFVEEQIQGHQRRNLNLMAKPDFELLMAGRPEGELWLNNPAKRVYYGLLNDPSKPEEHDRKLNLWHGFGIQPVQGDVSPFLGFVHTLLAQQNEIWRDYMLDWLAWVIQHPGERIGVVLCLISATEGTGKGTLGNLMLSIFGQHGRSIADPEGLTGHFNAMLADALFVFADEALFAGDRRGADRFKNRVTEPLISITPKGVDSIQMENRVSYMMATNHRFAASVSFSDRRFAMFEVSEHKQLRAYWNDLHEWLQHHGRGIVLDFLQRRDLSGFHPADSRPRTPIYLEARRQSLCETHRWWHEVLEAEDLNIGFGAFPTSTDISGEIEKATLYDLYLSWHKKTEHRASRPAQRSTFFRDLYAMTDGAVREARPGPRGEQKRVVVFPMKAMPTGLPTTPIDWTKLQMTFEQWLSQR